jgi:hypothetical protein
MRNLSYPALCLLLSFIINSCSRNDVGDNNNTPNGKFEFYANGSLIQMNKTVAVNENLTTAGSVLTISATNGSAASAIGGIDNYNGPRLYNLNEDNSNYIALSFNGKVYYLTGGNALAPQSSGVITITDEITNGNFKNTKGTFSGVAYASSNDSVVIANGVFEDDDF